MDRDFLSFSVYKVLIERWQITVLIIKPLFTKFYFETFIKNLLIENPKAVDISS